MATIVSTQSVERPCSRSVLIAFSTIVQPLRRGVARVLRRSDRYGNLELALAAAGLLLREDRFGTDAEMTRGDTDLHRAKNRGVGQDVALLAQKDKAIRLHGLHVVDRQVLLGAADQTGGQVHFAPFDKHVRLDADAVADLAAGGCAFSLLFRMDGTCGTINGNHVGTSLWCRLARAGLVFAAPSRLALRARRSHRVS